MPSSVIAKFDYDAEHAGLTITFVTGRVYQYFAVPATVAADFGRASSKGAFFNTQIRDRYPFSEVTPRAAPRKRSAR